jgi:hypothetical protein
MDCAFSKELSQWSLAGEQIGAPVFLVKVALAVNQTILDELCKGVCMGCGLADPECLYLWKGKPPVRGI